MLTVTLACAALSVAHVFGDILGFEVGKQSGCEGEGLFLCSIAAAHLRVLARVCNETIFFHKRRTSIHY